MSKTLFGLLRDQRASMPIIIAALMLPLLASAGFAFDAGRFYLSQNRDQLAADMAVTAAAIAYNGTQSETIAATQACVTAAMNAVSVTCSAPLPTTVSTSFGTAPGTALPGVHVVVSTTLHLSPFGALIYPVGQHNTLPVKAGAWAAIQSNAPPCLEALVPSTAGITGIGLQGSAAIDAPGCSVQSGGPISITGGTSMTAQSVISGSTITHTNGTTFNSTNAAKANYAFPPPAPTTKAPYDPFASNPTVTADFSHLSTVSSYSATNNNVLPIAPSNTTDLTPSCSGGVGTVNGGNYRNLTLTGTNCTFTVTGPISVSGTLTIGDSSGNIAGVSVILPNNGTYNINSIVDAAGANGSGSFKGAVIKTTGSTFNIYNGIIENVNAAELSIGCSAAFTVMVTGQAYTGCSGSDLYSNTYNIRGGVTTNQGGSIVFGNGNFTISGGVTIGNGTPCGPTNTIQFGNGTSFVMTDTGVSLVGGCMVFGTAANHDINAGGASKFGINNPYSTTQITLGSGTYTINGGIQLLGGSTSTGSNITLVLSGDLVAGQGANNINWSAPTASPFLVLTNSSDGGTGSTSPTAVNLSGGTGGTKLTGVVYAPNGGLVLSGSAAINANASSLCFSLVARVITETGGTATAGVCPNAGGSSGGQIALVQ